MVVHTVKSGAPDAVTLLYTPPGRSGRPGEVKLVDASGTMNTVASYTEPGQLVGAAGRDPRGAARRRRKERRYLQAFRQRHFEFLQRYNSIKHRLKEELDRRKKKHARAERLAAPCWARAPPITGGCGRAGAASRP